MTARAAILAPALLGSVVLAGCRQDHVCTAVGIATYAAVDVGGLPVDPASTGARLCVADDCADLPVRTDPRQPRRVLWRQAIPDRDRVRLSLELRDRETGAERYRGAGEVRTEVAYPNGPGCDRHTVLPPVRATPDGRLVP